MDDLPSHSQFQHRSPPRHLSTVWTLGWLLLSCLSASAEPTEVVALSCDSRPLPAEVPCTRPSLGWQVQSTERGWKQAAYQVRVARGADSLAREESALWDSGRIESDQSQGVPYAGPSLEPRQRVFWSVRVWDSGGRASSWSTPAEWTAGVTSQSQWQAHWIGAPLEFPRAASPLFRKPVRLAGPVRRATARLASLGWSELTINGVKVSADLLGPPFTDHHKRVLYVTYDVTQKLAGAEAVLGLALGNGQFSPVVAFGGRPDNIVVPGDDGFGYHKRYGRFGPPAVLLELELEYADGTISYIGTDSTWRTTSSCVTSNDLWRGEKQDLRLDPVGWDKPGFDAANWPLAVERTAPSGTPEPCTLPPIRRQAVLRPDKVEGNVATFEQTGAGWPRLEVEGKPGQTITINGQIAERLKLPPLEFKLRGGGREVLEPKWLFNEVARTVTVEGLDTPLSAEQLSFPLGYSELQSAGSFESSDPFFNATHAALLRTHRNYVFGLPMDPSREKQSWTQDVQNMMDSAVYLTDSENLYRSWWRDLRANQTPDGYLGAIVPVAGLQTHDWNCPWWSGMIVYLPWKHYEYYGDRAFLAEAYEPMKAYVAFLGKRAQEGLRSNGGTLRGLPDPGTDEDARAKGLLSWGTGDWMGLDKPPVTLTSTAAWSYYADVISRTATILGKADEAREFAALSAGIRERFNQRYLDSATGLYDGPKARQSSQVLPLALGLVPEAQRPSTFARLVDTVHAAGDHLTTGFIGTPFLLRVLSEGGRPDLAATIVSQRDYPGWATLVRDGVFKETWKGEHALMPSLGGPVGAWFYRTVLGIRPDPSGPGFKRFLLQPEIVSGLTWAKGHFDSRYGRISSDWALGPAGDFTFRFSVPANTTATIVIPAVDAASVTESGQPAGNCTHLRLVREVNGRVVFEAGSGIYVLRSRVPGEF